MSMNDRLGDFLRPCSIRYLETLCTWIDFGVFDWNHQGQEKPLLILKLTPVTCIVRASQGGVRKIRDSCDIDFHPRLSLRNMRSFARTVPVPVWRLHIEGTGLLFLIPLLIRGHSFISQSSLSI